MSAEIATLRQLVEAERLPDISASTDLGAPLKMAISPPPKSVLRRTARQATGTSEPMLANDEATARRFKDTVMPYLNDAYNLARYLTRNPQDAEDVVQDAYLRAFRFFGTFKGSNARPWLLAIVRNCFYSWVKAKPRNNAQSLTDVDLDDLNSGAIVSDLWTSDPTDPEKILMQIDDTETVRTLVERLPAHFREALVLREMEDLSYQEIAEVTDVPIGTVMSRLARARQLFKAAWLEHQNEERRA